jgi:hypothetical protein
VKDPARLSSKNILAIARQLGIHFSLVAGESTETKSPNSWDAWVSLSRNFTESALQRMLELEAKDLDKHLQVALPIAAAWFETAPKWPHPRTPRPSDPVDWADWQDDPRRHHGPGMMTLFTCGLSCNWQNKAKERALEPWHEEHQTTLVEAVFLYYAVTMGATLPRFAGRDLLALPGRPDELNKRETAVQAQQEVQRYLAAISALKERATRWRKDLEDQQELDDHNMMQALADAKRLANDQPKEQAPSEAMSSEQAAALAEATEQKEQPSEAMSSEQAAALAEAAASAGTKAPGRAAPPATEPDLLAAARSIVTQWQLEHKDPNTWVKPRASTAHPATAADVYLADTLHAESKHLIGLLSLVGLPGKWGYVYKNFKANDEQCETARAIIAYMEDVHQLFLAVYDTAVQVNMPAGGTGPGRGRGGGGGGGGGAGLASAVAVGEAKTGAASGSEASKQSDNDDDAKAKGGSKDELQTTEQQQAHALLAYLDKEKIFQSFNNKYEDVLTAALLDDDPGNSGQGQARLILTDPPYTEAGRLSDPDNLKGFRDTCDFYTKEGSVLLVFGYPDAVEPLTKAMEEPHYGSTTNSKPPSKWTRRLQPFVFVRTQHHNPKSKRHDHRKNTCEFVYEFRRDMLMPNSEHFWSLFGTAEDGVSVGPQSLWYKRGQDLTTYMKTKKRTTKAKRAQKGPPGYPHRQKERLFIPVPKEYIGIDLRRSMNQLPLKRCAKMPDGSNAGWSHYSAPTRQHRLRNENGAIRPCAEKNHLHLEPFIIDYTNRGDLVMDMFAGTFTTARAALDQGRRFIGMEVDETCYKLAIRRLVNYLKLRIASPSDPDNVDYARIKAMGAQRDVKHEVMFAMANAPKSSPLSHLRTPDNLPTGWEEMQPAERAYVTCTVKKCPKLAKIPSAGSQLEGLFHTGIRPLPGGTVIGCYVGQILPRRAVKDNDMTFKNPHMKTRWILRADPKCPMYKVNDWHNIADGPNCTMIEAEDLLKTKPEQWITFKTAKEVSIGEQFLVDYGGSYFTEGKEKVDHEDDEGFHSDNDDATKSTSSDSSSEEDYTPPKGRNKKKAESSSSSSSDSDVGSAQVGRKRKKPPGKRRSRRLTRKKPGKQRRT